MLSVLQTAINFLVFFLFPSVSASLLRGIFIPQEYEHLVKQSVLFTFYCLFTVMSDAIYNFLQAMTTSLGLKFIYFNE